MVGKMVAAGAGPTDDVGPTLKCRAITATMGIGQRNEDGGRFGLSAARLAIAPEV